MSKVTVFVIFDDIFQNTYVYQNEQLKSIKKRKIPSFIIDTSSDVFYEQNKFSYRDYRGNFFLFYSPFGNTRWNLTQRFNLYPGSFYVVYNKIYFLLKNKSDY